MKNNIVYKMFVASLLAVSVAPSFAQESTGGADETTDIPVVPASVMRDNVPAPIVATHQSTSIMNESPRLEMEPGVNQIIPIAVGHPNRIVTPFSEPEITSTSLSSGANPGECGEVCIKDNVIYVATDKYDVPVTMFITEKGSEAQALSLTMVPRKIPPREVFLTMKNGVMAGIGNGSAKAQRWEESQPYLDTIRRVFRDLALGEIPSGYTMSETPTNIQLPKCRQPGMKYDFVNGQYVMGHHLFVFIGTVQNLTNEPREVKPPFCGNWDVAAVTTWPLTVLHPGQKTEIYVASKHKTRLDATTKRPSLIGGGQ